MGGFLPYEGEALVEHHLTPVVHSLDQIRACWTSAGALRGSRDPYHLKIDSGMNRLGTRAGRG
jgi:alanine racemase